MISQLHWPLVICRKQLLSHLAKSNVSPMFMEILYVRQKPESLLLGMVERWHEYTLSQFCSSQLTINDQFLYLKMWELSLNGWFLPRPLLKCCQWLWCKWGRQNVKLGWSGKTSKEQITVASMVVSVSIFLPYSIRLFYLSFCLSYLMPRLSAGLHVDNTHTHTHTHTLVHWCLGISSTPSSVFGQTLYLPARFTQLALKHTETPSYPVYLLVISKAK